MVYNRANTSKVKEKNQWKRTAITRQTQCAQWNIMGLSHRSFLEGYSFQVSAISDLPSLLSTVGQKWSVGQDIANLSRRFKEEGKNRPHGMFHRWHFCKCQKRGLGIGKTKRGKGTKIMAITDASGLPIAIRTNEANTHEVKLVESTIDSRFIREKPKKIIGDLAYDSDPLDKKLKKKKIELIAPHKENRKKKATQDGRVLRRYCRRWKVERLFAWIHNFRRCVVRYDYHKENYLGFVQLACIIILSRYF